MGGGGASRGITYLFEFFQDDIPITVSSEIINSSIYKERVGIRGGLELNRIIEIAVNNTK